MAARSVRAYLHNDTNAPLVKVSDECPSGEWTTRAPDRIEANSVAMMRAESILLGGVESRAIYEISNTREQLYVHWNNPTAGSNSYHTNTGAGHYAFWSAPTSGADPVAHFVLRPAGRFDTDFLPSHDGFRFSNSWGDVPYSLPPLRGSLLDMKYGSAENGLCGGMVLGALDYFVAGNEIPSMNVAPAGEQDRLFIHFVNRLFDTFSVNSVTLLLKLMNPLYPDGDENILNTFGLANGRAAVMAHQEWPIIRAEIDAGRPSPVCVVTVKSLNPGDLGKNHQVLAYAYTAAGHDVTLHLYDPNQPGNDDVHMKFNDGDVSQRIVVEHNLDVGGRPVYCFVRMDGGPGPIPFDTRPRLTRMERKARRVRLAPEDQRVVSLRRVAEGRGLFDVWPDCGEQEFPYTVDEAKVVATVTATTPHYRNPLLTWKINGVDVAEGGDRELRVPVEALRPDLAPPRERPGDGKATIRTSIDGARLQIVNDPADGNYTLVAQVQAVEADDAASVTRSTTAIEFVGLTVSVPGLREASAGCWKDYLNRHREGLPQVGAVVDALYAQLRRPGDPLWDPDPGALEIGIAVAENDPTVKAVTRWREELQLVAPVGAGPAVTLDAEAIRNQLTHIRTRIGLHR